MHPNHEYKTYGSNWVSWGERAIGSKVYCDRGEEDSIAVFIEHKNEYYFYAIDLKLQPINKKINLERYISIYLAQSLGVKVCELYINGIGELEDELVAELNKNFLAVRTVVKGKMECGVSGYRVTNELLYMVEDRKLFTPNPVRFTLGVSNRERLTANDIINAIHKPWIQQKTFNYITEAYISPFLVSSKAFFLFELRFFVRSFDVLRMLLNPMDVEYDGFLIKKIDAEKKIDSKVEIDLKQFLKNMDDEDAEEESRFKNIPLEVECGNEDDENHDYL